LNGSLTDATTMPSRTQITRHDCVEGWSCIGKWKGLRLSALLERARLKPNARYIVFYCADALGAQAPRPNNTTSPKSRNDAEAASVLMFVIEFEETVEPDPRLKRFHDWLQAKGNDPTAVLARWWIDEFAEAEGDDPFPEGPAPTLH
jgi:hypothetical protein